MCIYGYMYFMFVHCFLLLCDVVQCKCYVYYIHHIRSIANKEEVCVCVWICIFVPVYGLWYEDYNI